MMIVWRRGFVFVLTIALLGVFGTRSISAQTRPSPFAGQWAFVSVGDDPGSGAATVDNAGNIEGSGTTKFAGSITVSGTVSEDGTFAFTGVPAGAASTTATFTGRVTDANTAAGNWINERARMKGSWSAKRTEPTSTTPSTGPTTVAPPTSQLTGVDTTWPKSFRTPRSLARCYINRPLYPWNFNLLEYGIRFSWSKTGLFTLETANYSSPKAKSYAHLLFSVSGVKAEGTNPAATLNQKQNRFELDVSSPTILDDPQRMIAGPFDNVQVILSEGTTAFTRAVGKIEFAAPEASGYCLFDLQTPKKKR
jgi:hypothetical protein